MISRTLAQIRQLFLEYFQARGHTIVPSSSLVPIHDPTLMFTNAGMVPFKDVFTGSESRAYRQAVSCQKCMRVSGKHNDLEEVGRTPRHHTFFEMLGNFSFGSYFKKQAIDLAWTFIRHEVGLSPEKLWITVFGGDPSIPADDEASHLWQSISGLPASRILKRDMQDNFWSMGPIGPCGPCSEIYYDWGHGPASDADFDNGRIVEIWNNVFMQFERKATGQLAPLPTPSVDTGMGLERLAAVVQGVTSNYHTDLFMPLLESVAHASGKRYHASDADADVSMRVIADHARATAFLVADGMQPSNEGRGYVLRRIMRRAIHHGQQLGLTDLFLHRICDQVVQSMGETYPELVEARSLIEKVAALEEENFRRTLETGLRMLASHIHGAQAQKSTILPGEVAFKLYDTYGFPKDLTQMIAAQAHLQVDEEGFNHLMQAQKERSRGGEVGDAAVATVYKRLSLQVGPIAFIGYPQEEEPLESRIGTWRWYAHQGKRYLETLGTVRALLLQGTPILHIHPTALQEIPESPRVEIIIDPTPFYGEGGGQVGDRGILHTDAGFYAEVVDTQKPLDMLTLCRVRILEGSLHVGDSLWAGYEARVRQQTRAHHSATHLLHGALRNVLGPHVKQAGSWVDDHRLRFDFTHFAALSPQELRAVESDVQRRIEANQPIISETLPLDQAKQKGALAFFGDRYGDQVRVITMGESIEFCGGTHASSTGALGMLLIQKEEAVQSGVRRIEASVGEAARATAARLAARLTYAAQLLKGQPASYPHEDPEAEPVFHVLRGLARSYEENARQTNASSRSFAETDFCWPEVPSAGSESSIASSLRDTWQGLLQWVNAPTSHVDGLIARYATSAASPKSRDLFTGFASLWKENRDKERLKTQHQSYLRTQYAQDLLGEVQQVGGIPVLCCRLQDHDRVQNAADLRALADALRSKMPSGVVCLGLQTGPQQVALLLAVSPDLTRYFNANHLMKMLTPLIEGRGGGKLDLAQAGGHKPEGLEAAFATLLKQVSHQTPQVKKS